MNSTHSTLFAATRVSSVVVLQAAIFFTNLLYLSPRLLEQGKKAAYSLSLAGIVVAYTVFMSLFDMWIDQFMPIPSHSGSGSSQSFFFIIIFRFMSCVPPIVVSMLIVKSVLLNKKKKEALELHNRMLEAETKALKAQINPHFLFNTLNNIYSLSQMKSDKTGTAIMNLSEILRYVTYDSNQKLVSLKDEIRQIENFIELQYLKDDEHDNIEVEINIENSSLQIAPLLLIPFIENTFKHGNHEDKENGWIKIHLTSAGNQLTLQCSNSKLIDQPKDKTGGVGLDNVRKRLNLIYPDQHELIINGGVDQYETILKINLA